MVKYVKLLWPVLWTLACYPLTAWSQPATAPEPEKAAERDPRGPSVDGAYWFEVEVTVFSSVYGGSKYSEIPVLDNNNLRYPAQMRRLQNQVDSYQFPFEADLAPPQFAANAVSMRSFGEGPTFSPADPGAFKILDPERDPFIELDRRFWRFNQLNSRLQSTDEHKVLWHQVWRQPIHARAQTPALQVEGGSKFGEHYELEGSVRVSGTDNQASLDANLWLSSFSRNRAGQGKLPDRPAPPAATNQFSATQSAGLNSNQVPVEPWYADSVWHLNQNRDLGPNALYSLDHPALGVLIEIRPYLVPEPRVPGAAAIKPVGKRGFE